MRFTCACNKCSKKKSRERTRLPSCNLRTRSPSRVCNVGCVYSTGTATGVGSCGGGEEKVFINQSAKKKKKPQRKKKKRGGEQIDGGVCCLECLQQSSPVWSSNLELLLQAACDDREPSSTQAAAANTNDLTKFFILFVLCFALWTRLRRKSMHPS